MRDAAALAVRGEPHGTVVVAEQQTAGIGRHGHTWHSEAGAGLYISIILRPALAPDALPVLTMALGIAARRAIDEVTGVQCDIRWPNDLLLNGRKVAGIMVQSADGALIAGIGINANQTAFPEKLRSIATSLRLETGTECCKEGLLDRVVEQALAYTKLLEEQGKAAIFREFETLSSYVSGRPVEVTLGDRKIEGITAGLDSNGFLLVKTDEGVETIVAGGVRARAICIVPHDSRWTELYRREEERLRGLLGPKVLRIEHTGSTSVPRLAAKPVIDLLLVVADSADEAAYLPALAAAGYVLRIREPEWFEHRMFKGPDTDINLHVFSQGCEEVGRILLFRDWLRCHEADRELYARTKLELAAREWKSVDDYAAAKSPVIRAIMTRAQADARKNVLP
jgi:biotin-[acetyl-CoA-carboxylase] ligase BirA-like protein